MMRFLLLLTLAVAGCLGDSTAPVAVPYSSPDGKFSIDFPGVPQVESTLADPLMNKAEGATYLVDNDKRAYLVRYTRFASPVVLIEESLDSARDNFRRDLGGELLQEKRIEFQDYPAREFIASMPAEKLLFRVRIVITDFEVFQVVAAVPEGEERSAATDAYFASFQLLNVLKGKPDE